MSKAVVHRGVVYTSGQTAADAGDCVAAQTEACLAKVDELLAAAGTSKERALMATIWLKDISSDFRAARPSTSLGTNALVAHRCF